MWTDYHSVSNASLIVLKLLSGLCCFLIILRDYWPKFWIRHLNIFWKFTLVFCLVFAPCYLSYENGFDISSVLNFSVYVVILSLLVTWLDFLWIVVAGVLLASIFSTPISVNTDNLLLLFYVGGFCSLAGMVFSRSKEKAIKEKFGYFRSIAASIAHELRTPLSALRMSNEFMKLHLNTLIETYKKTGKQEISEQHLEKIRQMPDQQESTMRRAFLIIDLLLNNIKTFNDSIKKVELSMLDVVSRSLEDYPFREEEKRIVHVDILNGFQFKGDEDVVKHILHNLIKNALYFTNDVEGPRIDISFQVGNEYNVLSFRDNGSGIKFSDLPYIFDDFYSKRRHGTGVGLSFCKMAMKKHGGDISCISELGKYTQFLLIFPRIGKKI